MKILFLDDQESRYRALLGTPSAKLVTWAKTAAEAIDALTGNDFDLLMLDHDLAEEHYAAECADDTMTGYAVAKWLCEHGQRHRAAAVVVHSLNGAASARMVATLAEAGFYVSHLPFGWLKV